MPAISAERRQQRYDTILEAAQQCFSELGFEAVSITQVAESAKVSDGLVYHYFKDKRDLLFHVLRAFYGRIVVDLEDKVFKRKTFEARLEALIRTHLEVFVADRGLCRLFISEVRVAPDYAGSEIQELNRVYTSLLLRIVDEGISNGEIIAHPSPRLLRDAIFGAIEHRAWRHVNGQERLNAANTARELTRLFTHGLARPPSGNSA